MKTGRVDKVCMWSEGVEMTKGLNHSVLGEVASSWSCSTLSSLPRQW